MSDMSGILSLGTISTLPSTIVTDFFLPSVVRLDTMRSFTPKGRFSQVKKNKVTSAKH